MKKKQYLFPGMLSFLTYEICSVTPAWASSGFTYEEKTNLLSLIWITFCSAVVTSNVLLRHNWKSRKEEWPMLFESTSAVSLITALCFAVSLLPLVHRVAVPDAMFVVYLPSITLSFLILTTSLWVRTISQAPPLSVSALIQNPSGELELQKKAFRQWMKERRIEKRRKYWKEQEKLREKRRVQSYRRR